METDVHDIARGAESFIFKLVREHLPAENESIGSEEPIPQRWLYAVVAIALVFLVARLLFLGFPS